LIIQRYLLREIVLSFLGVSTVLLLIFMSVTFIRLLGDAADGEFPVDMVLQLFLLKSGAQVVFILPFALLLTVMLALGRLYRDSEMAALSACGIGPGQLLLMVARPALIVALLLALATLWWVPQMEAKAVQLIATAAAERELQGVAAGRFTQPLPGGPLLYVEQSDEAGGRGLFGYIKQPNGDTHIITAERASRSEQPNGDQFIIFERGHRYEDISISGRFRIIEFERHAVRIQQRRDEMDAGGRVRAALPTSVLLASHDRREQAELQWRLAVPIGALLLALLAVPLAESSPRQGRYGRLLLGVLIYILYTNLLTVGKSQIARGAWPPQVGLWWVHGLALLLLGWLLWRQRRLPREAA